MAMNYNKDDWAMWEGGPLGLFAGLRRMVKRFVLTSFYDNTIMLCVLFNTVVLAMDGLVDAEGDKVLNDFNLSFTFIFTADMALKQFGMGIADYFADGMNCFDAVIVALSLVELAIFGTGGGAGMSAFKSIRIFRTFRVLRVTRLIRSL